jgi:hypothetical protein
MATSGSANWSLTRDELITAALRKLGVLASGGTPTTAQINDAEEALNAIIKACHADGMPLWATASTLFTVTSGTSVYSAGPGQTVPITVGPPLKITQAWLTDANDVRRPLSISPRYDFHLYDPETTGTPHTLFYAPYPTLGNINLYPTPDNSTDVITISYTRPFEDMDAAGNDFDFPAYWMMALIYLLAWALAPEYGTPATERNMIRDEARFWKTEALSYGTEEGSIRFQPYRRN